jgi:hypothetical protein
VSRVVRLGKNRNDVVVEKIPVGGQLIPRPRQALLSLVSGKVLCDIRQLHCHQWNSGRWSEKRFEQKMDSAEIELRRGGGTMVG